MTEKKKTLTFEEINRLDVSEHVEKKMNLSYLSWAWAWQEMKKIDENAEVIVHEFPEFVAVGDTVQTVYKPYMNDNGGAWVKVSVTLNNRTETEWLPVMDHRNKAMTNPDAMSVNKNIKRCFVKALALHGLGLYIYAGEDLPEAEPVKKVTATQAKALEAAIEDVAKDADKTPSEMKALIFKKQNVRGNVTDLNEDQYGLMLNYIRDLKSFYEKERKNAAKEEKKDAEQESLFEGNTVVPKGV